MKTLKSLESLALETLKETAETCDREDDLIDLVSEVADGCVPVYYSDLYEVFADSPDAINAALEDYISETGGEDIGERVKNHGLSSLISLGIYWHLEQYLHAQASKVWSDKESEGEDE
jgi:hypothetical protein